MRDEKKQSQSSGFGWGTVHTGQDRSGQLDFKRTDHWEKVGEKNK